MGCKIDYKPEEGRMKITNPVLLQSFADEFELPDGPAPLTPAEPGKILHAAAEGDAQSLGPAEHSLFRRGVGKLLHMDKKSRPEIKHAVRDLTRAASNPTRGHMDAVLRCMKHCAATPNRGLVVEPNARWDGNPEFLFEVA